MIRLFKFRLARSWKANISISSFCRVSLYHSWYCSWPLEKAGIKWLNLISLMLGAPVLTQCSYKKINAKKKEWRMAIIQPCSTTSEIQTANEIEKNAYHYYQACVSCSSFASGQKKSGILGPLILMNMTTSSLYENTNWMRNRKWMLIRGGKMCQIVEGHKITEPRKSGGPERLFLLISQKSGGTQAPWLPSSATPFDNLLAIW